MVEEARSESPARQESRVLMEIQESRVLMEIQESRGQRENQVRRESLDR